MSLFHQWKSAAQMPLRPATLSPGQELLARTTFYAGARGSLNEIRAKWPAVDDPEPLAKIAAVIVAMEQEILDHVDKTNRVIATLEENKESAAND